MNETLSSGASQGMPRPKITCSVTRSVLNKFLQRLDQRHQWITPLMREEERMKGLCLCCVPGLDKIEAHHQWLIPTLSSMDPFLRHHLEVYGTVPSLVSPPMGSSGSAVTRSVGAVTVCVFMYIVIIDVRLDTVWSISKLLIWIAGGIVMQQYIFYSMYWLLSDWTDSLCANQSLSSRASVLLWHLQMENIKAFQVKQKIQLTQ